MEIGQDKTKLMTNNPNKIKIKDQRLEKVDNFKYLGAIISNEGLKPEILTRIAQTTAALSIEMISLPYPPTIGTVVIRSYLCTVTAEK